MWRVYRAAGRPWPELSDDPVVDYQVMEAVYLKVQDEDRQAAKAQHIKEWQQEQKERLKKQFG